MILVVVPCPSFVNIHFRATVIASLMNVIMVFVDAIPLAYRTMFSIPNVVLMTMMAGRVFRNTKFGHFKESSISTSNILFPQDGQKNGNTPLSSPAIPLKTLQFANREETSRVTQSSTIPMEAALHSEHWQKELDGKHIDHKLNHSEMV